MKELLLKACFEFVNEKIRDAETAITTAREAQQDDTKSSAGDKYETTREMMTQEIENHLKQLAALHQQRIMLQALDTDKANQCAEAGSLVETDRGFFFISISAGTIELEGKKMVCISPSSPIANAMIGCKAGQQFEFRNTTYHVSSVR